MVTVRAIDWCMYMCIPREELIQIAVRARDSARRWVIPRIKVTKLHRVWSMAGEGARINTNLIAREMDSENRRFEVEKCNMSIDKIAVAAVKSKEKEGCGWESNVQFNWERK